MKKLSAYKAIPSTKKHKTRIMGLPGYFKHKTMTRSWTTYIYTSCICFTNLLVGIMDRQLGTALQDIQQRTNVDFTEALTYISVMSFGSIVGCVVVAVLYDRVVATCYFGALCALLAILEAVLPWCVTDVAAYVVHFGLGICYGNILSLIVAELCALWGNDVAVPLLMSYFFLSTGGIISSVVTAPFLCKPIEIKNYTETIHVCSSQNVSLSSTSKNSTFNRGTFLNNELYIPFTISAMIDFMVALSFFILFYKSSRNTFLIKYLDNQVRSPETDIRPFKRITVLLTIGFLMILIGSMAYNTLFVLPYFLVKQARFSRSDAAYAISLYTATLSIGRIAGFLIVRHIGTYRLIIGNTVIALVSMIGLLNCVTFYSSISAIYTTIITFGIGYSVFLPSVNALLEEKFFPVTGFISGFMILCCMVGEILTTSCMGYFLKSYSPFLFLYVTICQLLLFLFFILVTNYLTIIVKFFPDKNGLIPN